MTPFEKIDQLVEKGNSVLRTHTPNPPNVIGFPTLNDGAFTEWRTQSHTFLANLLGSGHTYLRSFGETVKRPYQSAVQSGLGILKAVREDLEAGDTDVSTSTEPLKLLEQ